MLHTSSFTSSVLVSETTGVLSYLMSQLSFPRSIKEIGSISHTHTSIQQWNSQTSMWFQTVYLCFIYFILQYTQCLLVATNLYFWLCSQDKPTFQTEIENFSVFWKGDVHFQIFSNDILHPCSLPQTIGRSQPTIFNM